MTKYYNSFETRAVDVDFYFFPSKGGDWKNIKRTVDKEIKRSKHENFEIWLLYHYYKYDEIGECNKKKYIKKLEKKWKRHIFVKNK